MVVAPPPVSVFKLTQAGQAVDMEAELLAHHRPDEAVFLSALSAVWRGLSRTAPVGSFIFAGPPASAARAGQTLAEFLFDDEDALIRVDMSEPEVRGATLRCLRDTSLRGDSPKGAPQAVLRGAVRQMKAHRTSSTRCCRCSMTATRPTVGPQGGL